MPTRITVWNEHRHEKSDPNVAKVYPQGIHGAIASQLRQSSDLIVRTATLDEPEHGLTEQVVNETDVMVWWGHMAHEEVKDAVVQRVYDRVMAGMGLIVLHSGHFSKIFRKLMGTTCNLKWREDERDREVLWVARPGHPIVRDLDDHFVLPHEEMYGEFFDIPEPDETVLISSFTGGEVFRSGVTYRRGKGKVFYFRPGHETFPTYYDKNVVRILENAVRWAAPAQAIKAVEFGNKPFGWWEPKK
jgi:trehalose utilization protein